MIVVTGATGHLGSHVLYELALRNRPVRAMYHSALKREQVRKIFSFYTPEPESLLKHIEWIGGDIRDTFFLSDLLKGASQVFHTAGMVSFRRGDKHRLIEINATGTANLVNACMEQGIEKLCHVSSIASLGESLPGEPVTEDMIWNSGTSASPYSLSKFLGEMEVWRGIHEGLNAVIVNPSVIIGPGMWYNHFNGLFRQLSIGLKYYPVGTGGYVDVRDVARIMIQLADSEISAERYIINAENLPHKTILDTLASGLQQPLPTRRITPLLMRMACTAESIRSLFTARPPRITRRSMEIASLAAAYSNRKVLSLPVQFISVHESLQLAARLFLEESKTPAAVAEK